MSNKLLQVRISFHCWKISTGGFSYNNLPTLELIIKHTFVVSNPGLPFSIFWIKYVFQAVPRQVNNPRSIRDTDFPSEETSSGHPGLLQVFMSISHACPETYLCSINSLLSMVDLGFSDDFSDFFKPTSTIALSFCHFGRKGRYS